MGVMKWTIDSYMIREFLWDSIIALKVRDTLKEERKKKEKKKSGPAVIKTTKKTNYFI